MPGKERVRGRWGDQVGPYSPLPGFGVLLTGTFGTEEYYEPAQV